MHHQHGALKVQLKNDTTFFGDNKCLQGWHFGRNLFTQEREYPRFLTDFKFSSDILVTLDNYDVKLYNYN